VKSLMNLYYRTLAKYPLIWVTTHEEGRFIRSFRLMLNPVGDNEGHSFYTWSLTEGLLEHVRDKESDEGDALKPVENTEDITEVLGHIKKVAENDAAVFAKRKGESSVERAKRRKEGGDSLTTLTRRIYVVKDPHPFMEIAPVRRYLRDLAEILPHTAGTTVILLSPQLTLPTDVEKQVSVVDFPLPTEDEMVPFVRRMVKENRKKLKVHPKEPEEVLRIARSCLGLTYAEAENVISSSIAEHEKILLQEIANEKKGIVEKSGVLKLHDPDIDLDDLGGMEDLKEELDMISAEIADPTAAKWPLPPPRGLLIGGPPGTGKSALAKAVAKRFKVCLIQLDFGSLMGSHVGESEGNMDLALKVIDSINDGVVWIDEVDKAFPGKNAFEGDSGTGKRMVGKLLTWMQERKTRGIIIMTCNDPRVLRPESIRAGRIDTFWWNDLPSAAQRENILAIHLAKRQRHPEDYALGGVAEVTEDFSGSELEQTVVKALRIAFHKKRDIKLTDLLTASKQIVPVAASMKEDITALREWAKNRARPTSTKKQPVRRAMARASREL